jgi:hypothetical protein
LAAWSLSDGSVTAFDPRVEGTVYDIALGPEGVYAGGEFTTVNSTKPANALAAFDATNGTRVSGWSPQISDPGYVYAVDVEGDTVYAGGNFTGANVNLPTEAPRANAAAFDVHTAELTSWDPHVAGRVRAVEAVGSTVYVGGAFQSVHGEPRGSVAAVTAGAGDALPWDPEPRGYVSEIAGDGSGIVVGGEFSSAGGVSRHNVAAIDLTSGEPTPFLADTDGTVYALAAGSNGVWAGGTFTHVNGGVERKYLANLDPATGVARPFAQELDDPVQALAVDGPTVYAGGQFIKVGATPRRHVAAFGAEPGTSGTLLAFDPDANGEVRALAIGDGTVYVGGRFTTLGGGILGRRGLAAVDPGSGVPTAWNPNPNNDVTALKAQGATVVAGGRFDAIGTVPRQGIAVLDAGSGAPTSFDAGLNGQVTAVESDGEQVFAAGALRREGPDKYRWLGAFDLASGGLAPWNPPFAQSEEEPVRAMAAKSHGWLVVGGDFLVDGGPVRTARFAAFRLPPAKSGTGGGSGGTGDRGGVGTTGDRTAPRLSRLTASRKRFRVGKLPNRGTMLSLTLSEPASVSFELLAVTTGRKTGKGCRKATRSNSRGKKCRLLVPAGSFKQRTPVGPSRVAFTGKLGKRSLKLGTYMLRAKPTDAAGNAGAARSMYLRVVR